MLVDVGISRMKIFVCFGCLGNRPDDLSVFVQRFLDILKSIINRGHCALFMGLGRNDMNPALRAASGVGCDHRPVHRGLFPDDDVGACISVIYRHFQVERLTFCVIE